MEFVRFMNSAAGRLLRIAVGIALVAVGIGSVGGLGGWVLAALGALFIAVGAGRLCLFGPLFRLDLHGNRRS